MGNDRDGLMAQIQRIPRSTPAKSRGYTLIEVYIVLCVLGILAAFVMPVLAHATVPAASATAASATATDKALFETPVYHARTEAYNSYRIPALLTTKRGTVLAFCEGRVKSRKDAGDIDILLRRSTDNGTTWTPAQIVWSDGENTCGNPCPVIDDATGAILLLMTRNNGDDHQDTITAGTSKGTRTVWITRSEDDGATWSAPREITSEVKLPDWRWYATGPGIGIQLRQGPHKGRLVIPCDHSEPAGQRSHVIYSDDHGTTWHVGGGSPGVHTDESQVAELSDGRLVLNMRGATATERSRALCVSTDGGVTFTDLHHDPVLVESRCQGSLLSVPTTDAGMPNLLFSNPADPKIRQNMTVRLSRDDGRTWLLSRTLYSGPSGYSCLTALGDGTIGCFYERGLPGKKDPYNTITFARFPLLWLQGDTGSKL